MKSRFRALTSAAALILACVAAKAPDEGMWPLDTLERLPLRAMRARGLHLTPEQISGTHGPGLKDAVVLLGGGTASFVSPDGLMLTNHHVAFSALQSLSAIGHDYLNDGFLANTRDQELPTAYAAQVVERMDDVTREVLAGVADSQTPEERMGIIKANSAAVEAAAQKAPWNICRVYAMDSGTRFSLATLLVLRDIRLVYAPPGAIGNFGGEIDNWMWPRHTGDFAFMRAYVGKDGRPAAYAKDNVPFKPSLFLPLSTRGYTEGSFVMVLGFPGKTFRHYESAALTVANNVTLPTIIKLSRARMSVIEDAGNRDRALQIKYANRLRMMENTYKNFLGTLEGMKRSEVIARRQRDEQVLDAYIHATPGRIRRFGDLLSELGRNDSLLGAMEARQILLRSLSSSVDFLHAANIIREAIARPSSDSSGILHAGMGGPRAEATAGIAAVYGNYDEGVDKRLLTALILQSRELGEGQGLRLFRQIEGDNAKENRGRLVEQFVDSLYRGSALSSQAACMNLLSGPVDAIRTDPGIRFAADIAAERKAMSADSARISAALESLRGTYITAWQEWKQDTAGYPDANRSLRFSYGIVEGYMPRDGVSYGYQTSLSGVMEKAQETDPFIVPPRLRELWEKKDFGTHADPALGDVPVDFISDLDITGGNSGSPVINGDGELIGCAFDGNWESVVGDYVYEERFDRTISVDIRYVLFILDKFSAASNILHELTIR